ncbi:oxoglutarate dehydrogenase (succinyl-transferring) [Sarracenia purpurea var. burkii]
MGNMKRVSLMFIGALGPFRNHQLLIFCCDSLSDAEIVWCQEEPMNMGAYHYIAPRLGTAMRALDRGRTDDVKYVGRAPSAATATGFYQVHAKEQSELVQKAMQPQPISYPPS